MAGSLASINIKFFADLKQFSTSMANANRSLQKYGKQMQATGKSFSTYLTAPLAALTAVSLVSYNKQAQAIAQVEAGLKSTGSAVGYTSSELQKMASDLQNNTLFGDEEILQGATAQLLTFTNIAGTQFARTQQAALDLATRLDGDLKSASISLGKALNDPVANLSALSRSGIQFSEDQKAMINSLVQTNRLADAQTLILDELEKQYGGSAAAAAEAGTGGLKQLSNILGDVSEDIGQIINEALKPFVVKLKEWATAFKNLSPEVKKVIVVVGALAAAIGPLLVTLGFMMTTVLPGLITAFGGLKSAITGGLIPAFNSLKLAMLSNPITAIVVLITSAAAALYLFADRANSAALAQRNLNNAIEEGKKSAQEYEDISNASTQKQIDLINEKARAEIAETTNVKKIAAIRKKALEETINLLVKERSAINDRIIAYSTASAQYAADSPQRAKYNTLIAEESDFYEELGARIRSLTTDKKELAKANQATTPTGTGSKTNVAGLSVDTTGIDEGFLNIPNSLATATGLASTHLTGFQTKLTAFQNAAVEIGNEVGYAFENLGAGIANGLGLADSGFQGFAKGMIATVTKLIAMMLSQSIAQSIAGATASGAATGPAAIFTTPAFIATAVGGVLAAFAAIPKFADGGLVGGTSYYGDKLLALVNSGELILNTDQQKTMYNAVSGGGGTQYVPYIVGTKVSGNDLNIILKRQNKIDSRNG